MTKEYTSLQSGGYRPRSFLSFFGLFCLFCTLFGYGNTKKDFFRKIIFFAEPLQFLLIFTI